MSLNLFRNGNCFINIAIVYFYTIDVNKKMCTYLYYKVSIKFSIILPYIPPVNIQFLLKYANMSQKGSKTCFQHLSCQIQSLSNKNDLAEH